MRRALHARARAAQYVEEARRQLQQRPQMRHFLCVGLQGFVPEPRSYDVIWVQWCVGHLPCDDLVAFLRRCRDGLRDGGVLVLKENIAKSGFLFDDEDGSVTRSDKLFKQVFARAGLAVLREEQQQGFPKRLFRVNMYALR